MQRLQQKMFSCLLSWANEKKQDGKGYRLNKLAVELGVFFISIIPRKVIAENSNYELIYESLYEIAQDYSSFAAVRHDQELPSNRIREACNMLYEVGLIEELCPRESTSFEREEYGLGGGQIWKVIIRLNEFYYPESEKVLNDAQSG